MKLRNEGKRKKKTNCCRKWGIQTPKTKKWMSRKNMKACRKLSKVFCDDPQLSAIHSKGFD